MASVIDILVRETGDPGEVNIDLVTPAAVNVTIWYCQDGFNHPEIADWTEGPTVQSPDSLVLDLGNNNWNLIQATGTYLGDLQLAAVQRVKPFDRNPYYQLDIVQHTIEHYVVGRTIAYRFRLEAVNGVNLSDKVFLYEEVPLAAMDKELRDNFVAVCKPGDLETYPADAPEVGQVPPFYRLNAVDLVEENIFKLEQSIAAIVADVDELLQALEANR